MSQVMKCAPRVRGDLIIRLKKSNCMMPVEKIHLSRNNKYKTAEHNVRLTKSHIIYKRKVPML